MIFYRNAIRAVILRNEEVKLNTRDYKFPGGGVETGESIEETLMREVREETGYKLKIRAVHFDSSFYIYLS